MNAFVFQHRPNVWNRFSRRPRPLRFQEMLVFALDLSPSMSFPFRLSEWRNVPRIEALKEAAAFYLTQKAAASRLVQVSIIGFSGQARLLQNWTPLAHLPRVLATIGSLVPSGICTNIAGAIELALDRIAAFRTHPSTRRQTKVVLATDGDGNVATDRHDALIQRARAEGVRIFTIGIGNRRDCGKTFNRELLWRIAHDTHGRFSTAHSLDELKRALASAY